MWNGLCVCVWVHAAPTCERVAVVESTAQLSLNLFTGGLDGILQDTRHCIQTDRLNPASQRQRDRQAESPSLLLTLINPHASLPGLPVEEAYPCDNVRELHQMLLLVCPGQGHERAQLSGGKHALQGSWCGRTTRCPLECVCVCACVCVCMCVRTRMTF